MPSTMIAPAARYGMTSDWESSVLPSNSGRNTSGPSAAPNSEPNSTSEMPRPRLAGGYRSAAATRASSTVPLETPISMNPGITSSHVSAAEPAAASTQPATPHRQPAASTGTRPRRSIARPAGSAASAADARNTAGPSPRIDSMPVTRTSVIVATATTSCSIPERHVRVAARSTVERRTMCGSITAPSCQTAWGDRPAAGDAPRPR